MFIAVFLNVLLGPAAADVSPGNALEMQVLSPPRPPPDPLNRKPRV